MNIRLRLIAFTFCLVLLVGGSISFYSIYQGRQRIFTTFQRDCLEITDMLSEIVANEVYFLNLISLRRRLQNARVNPDISYTYVTDPEGVVLTDGTGKNPLRDQKLTSSFSAEMLSADDWISRIEEKILKIGGPILMADDSRVGYLQVGFSLDRATQVIRETTRTSFYLTLIFLGIGAILAYILAKSFSRPISSMLRASKEIGEGKLDTRLSISRSDELGMLAMSFNHMTESLAKRSKAQQQRLAELSILHSIGQVINSTLDLDHLIDMALIAVKENLGYDRAKLLLVDAEKQALVHGRIAGASAEIRAQLEKMEIPLREDSGFHAGVALSGEPVLLEDMEKVKDQTYSPLLDSLGTRSIMAVPLKVEDRILGVLSVNNFKTVRTLTGSDQNLLATVANQLAIAVDNALAYKQIEQLNINLEEKVWQRTEALQLEQQRLREVNIQLEAATRHKTQFLANMSHELRTPLNSIIGFSEVLLEKMFGQLNDKQEEYVDDIFTSGKYLLSLINDILDLSKIEAGKVELEPEVLDLSKLLQDSLVMVKEQALSHGIALQMDIADNLGPVIGDEQKIKQILFNLLSNAVKFTPDKGNVGIRAKKVHQAVQVSVWDTGIGIAPEDQQLIFKEFQQVDKGLAGKTEGTGLGLALSKKFVELHGGTIWVESTPDQGSTFNFTLPFEGMASHLPLTVAQDEFAEAPMDAAVPEGPLVLVIEDDPKAINLLKIYLSEGGYRVAIAGDGTEGLEKVRRLSPSVVILDVLLPKVDGWTFLTQVNADPTIKDVPVIILSIVDQKGKGFALGAADYLVKPVKKKELLRKLRDLSLVSKVQTSSVKVLAVDDDPRTLELLTSVLEPQGFRLLKACGGREGIAIAETEHPDLIILDLLMPNMNGFEVIDRLDKSPSTTRLPIIIFTVKQLTAEEKQRLKGRIIGLVRKADFNPKGFVGMVRNALQRNLGGIT